MFNTLKPKQPKFQQPQTLPPVRTLDYDQIQMVRALFRMRLHPKEIATPVLAAYMHITQAEALSRLRVLTDILYGTAESSQ